MGWGGGKLILICPPVIDVPANARVSHRTYNTYYYALYRDMNNFGATDAHCVS